MKRIIYFTAAQVPSSLELADIAALNGIAEKPYEVIVMHSDLDTLYGANPLVADFVAGTIPDAYKDEGTPIYSTFSITAPPNPPNLPATQCVVSDTQVLATSDGGTVTLTIVAGVITSAVYAAG